MSGRAPRRMATAPGITVTPQERALRLGSLPAADRFDLAAGNGVALPVVFETGDLGSAAALPGCLQPPGEALRR